MTALMIAGCLAVATLALVLSLLVGDALRRERREEDARRLRRARALRPALRIAARSGLVERRVAAAVDVTPDRRRAA